MLLLGFLIKLRQLNAQCFPNNGEKFLHRVYGVYFSVVIVAVVAAASVVVVVVVVFVAKFCATSAYFYDLRFISTYTT